MGQPQKRRWSHEAGLIEINGVTLKAQTRAYPSRRKCVWPKKRPPGGVEGRLPRYATNLPLVRHFNQSHDSYLGVLIVREE